MSIIKNGYFNPQPRNYLSFEDFQLDVKIRIIGLRIKPFYRHNDMIYILEVKDIYLQHQQSDILEIRFLNVTQYQGEQLAPAPLAKQHNNNNNNKNV